MIKIIYAVKSGIDSLSAVSFVIISNTKLVMIAEKQNSAENLYTELFL